MKLLECGCCHACAFRWGVTHVRNYLYWGFAHPVEGSPFQVHGEIVKAALIRGRLRRKPGCGFAMTCIRIL